MSNDIALIILALFYAGLFLWAFRVLPSARWQFLASVPTQQTASGTWSGVNLTYYGLLTAGAVTMAVAMMMVMLASLHTPLLHITLLIVTLLIVTVPAARITARMVERKANGFTIGGAAFTGLLAAPWVIGVINAVTADPTPGLPLVGSLAALTVAYAFGEGTGRLACMSFGCCYGKPVSAGPPGCRSLFNKHHFTFSGETKKAVYEGGFEAVPLIPIQAVTASVLIASALAGFALFLRNNFLMAFMITLFLTQGWRVLSEFLRADHRGGSRLTAYQIMALMGIFYGAILASFGSPDNTEPPDLVAGLSALWNPPVILSLQLLWLIIFLYTGRSTVTTAEISFSVLKDRI
ncbi:MAG: prolipoprotein diacylglyceryl transferase family protein [Nitrospiraceae bacterium]